MKKPKFPFTVTESGVSAQIRKLSQTKKDKRYTLFVVDYFLLGQRKRESRASFDEARQVALNACRRIANGEQTSLTLTRDDCLTYRRASKAVSSIRVPLDVAAHEYASAVSLLGGRASLMEVCRDWLKVHDRQLPRIAVADAGTLLVAQAKTDGKSNDRQKQLSAAIDALGKNLNVEVHTVTPNLLGAYLAALPFKDRTKANHRDVIKFFNRWLILRGYLPKGTDWLEGVQKYTKRKIGAIEIYTPDEMKLLLGGADKRLMPLLAIAAFAGLRHAEIGRLDWSEIDFEDGFIEVRSIENTKSDQRRRLVPIKDNLKVWLLAHRKKSGPVCPFKNITKQLLKLSAKVGVDWKRNALRHSRISYRVAESGDVPRVSDESGNSVTVIRSNYLQRVKPAVAAEWFGIMPANNHASVILDTPEQEPQLKAA